MYSPEMAELRGPHSSIRVVIWGLDEGRFSVLLQKQKLTRSSMFREAIRTCNTKGCLLV